MSRKLLSCRPVGSHASASSVTTINLPRPALDCSRGQSIKAFSTCDAFQMPRWRQTPRGNKLRGMSAIKGKGVSPWIKLSVTKDDLKTPRKLTHKQEPTRDDHGLWRFFNGKREILTEPYLQGKHGRAWTVEELRHKSWEDLHDLWWQCIYDRNRIVTEIWTIRATQVGFGETEGTARKQVVQTTMANIKRALEERWNAWEDAQKLVDVDPSLYTDVSGKLTYDASMEPPDDFYVNEVYHDAEEDELDLRPETEAEAEAADANANANADADADADADKLAAPPESTLNSNMTPDMLADPSSRPHRPAPPTT